MTVSWVEQLIALEGRDDIQIYLDSLAERIGTVGTFNPIVYAIDNALKQLFVAVHTLKELHSLLVSTWELTYWQ